MICFENVSFQYESERHPALREFTHSIAKGELVLLLGPSGCGKTTITRLLNGLVPHFYEGELKGIVRIGGRTTTETTIQSLADIVGSVFQDPRSQFFATDVTSEIAFSCENAGLPRNEIHRRVENASRKLGIESLLGRSIFALSSGEKQAVAVASVYAFAPSVIVMDEPSANLDPMATQKLREIIQALRTDGFTIVISEHRIHYLTDLVDRAIFIQNGKMIQEFQKDAFQAITNAEANKLGLRGYSWLYCTTASYSKFESQGQPRRNSWYCWTQWCWKNHSVRNDLRTAKGTVRANKIPWNPSYTQKTHPGNLSGYAGQRLPAFHGKRGK